MGLFSPLSVCTEDQRLAFSRAIETIRKVWSNIKMNPSSSGMWSSPGCHVPLPLAVSPGGAPKRSCFLQLPFPSKIAELACFPPAKNKSKTLLKIQNLRKKPFQDLNERENFPWDPYSG